MRLRCDGNTTATVMDGDGRCNGNATATTAMEHGGNGGGAPMSNGCHRGMLPHYGRASMHLKLLSFGYKYGAPCPHPLPPLDVRDLNCAPGHVSKFNNLLYLVGRSLLNPPGGRANNNCWRDCGRDCDNDDIYGSDGGGG